jgi:hypothetical protein
MDELEIIDKPKSDVPTSPMQLEDSCFATCADASHGSTGWSGAIRTGPNAAQQAEKDADEHDQANPGHETSISCSFR